MYGKLQIDAIDAREKNLFSLSSKSKNSGSYSEEPQPMFGVHTPQSISRREAAQGYAYVLAA